MSILRFLFQTLCAFLQIEDRKHIEQNFYYVAGFMPQGWDLGCWVGQKLKRWDLPWRPIDCAFEFVFFFSYFLSFFFSFFATFSFIFSRDVPSWLFYSFLALYMILMDLFLYFDIFKQFCYLAKCFGNTCKTYKYAKLKTSSLQNCILHKRKFN